MMRITALSGWDAPLPFSPDVIAAACAITCGDRLLLLLRRPEAMQGDRWCFPGGKLEPNEDPLQAALRETFEETGLRFERDHASPLGRYAIERPEVRYILYVFYVECKEATSVRLSDEHTEARWVTVEEGLSLPLIYGNKPVLEDWHRSRINPQSSRTSSIEIPLCETAKDREVRH